MGISWGFPYMGVPNLIIHFLLGIFHEINHPKHPKHGRRAASRRSWVVDRRGFVTAQALGVVAEWVWFI
jgi:hypothetical protein